MTQAQFDAVGCANSPWGFHRLVGKLSGFRSAGARVKTNDPGTAAAGIQAGDWNAEEMLSYQLADPRLGTEAALSCESMAWHVMSWPGLAISRPRPTSHSRRQCTRWWSPRGTIATYRIARWQQAANNREWPPDVSPNHLSISLLRCDGRQRKVAQNQATELRVCEVEDDPALEPHRTASTAGWLWLVVGLLDMAGIWSLPGGGLSSYSVPSEATWVLLRDRIHTTGTCILLRMHRQTNAHAYIGRVAVRVGEQLSSQQLPRRECSVRSGG